MLFKKAYRAIWAHKRSYLACVFLIMIGTMMLTAMGTAVGGLINARDYFYEEYRLAHVTAQVGIIPISAVDRLRNIPGILDVGHRTVIDVRAEVENSDNIITLRLSSFVPGEPYRINDFQVDGFEPAMQNDIVLNMMFKDAHGLEIGENITIFSQGRAFRHEVTGSFKSPEHAYIARGGTDILPDNAGFGIAYITEDGMNNLTGRVGTANQVLFTLMDGYVFEDVQSALQDALQPYGLIALNPRDAHISYAVLDMQILGMQAVSTTMPFVFVAMAVIVLYLMLKRIIEQERTQIGTLKAFGYSNKDMLLHYMAYGGITGVLGGLLGFLYGAIMSNFYLEMFLEFFIMPQLVQPVSPIYLVVSLAIAVGGGLLGSFMGATKALKLTPSEAMRPESPKPIKNDPIGKIKGLKFILTSRGQMALRGIVRNPFRSGFITLGVSFSFILLAIFGDMEGIVDTLLYAQFEDIRLYNVRVTLNRPIPYDQAVESAFAVPYITKAEGLWELPVTLVNRHLREGTLITGIHIDSRLFKIFDTNLGVSYPPPVEGLIITNGIADQLNAQAGDILYISTFLSRDYIPVPIAGVIEQNVGSGAFMEISALATLVEHPIVASAIIFNTDSLQQATDFFKESPLAATVDSTDATLQQYKDMMEPMSIMYSAMFLMGVAVAFAIIYNTATISLSERQREFATLRVLGLTVDEVCEIMRFEYRVLAAVGMAIGAPLASGVLVAQNAMLDTSMMSMPSSLSPMAYVSAAFGCIIAIMVSNFSAKRKIRKFDMVEVLKERA
ncbi:MAG: ABC transporter permease [Defluviitaleaceae bacterium]|nr:ABC transporter permease [Defluviitaleaceae bacterium]